MSTMKTLNLMVRTQKRKQMRAQRSLKLRKILERIARRILKRKQMVVTMRKLVSRLLRKISRKLCQNLRSSERYDCIMRFLVIYRLDAVSLVYMVNDD